MQSAFSIFIFCKFACINAMLLMSIISVAINMICLPCNNHIIFHKTTMSISDTAFHSELILIYSLSDVNFTASLNVKCCIFKIYYHYLNVMYSLNI